MSSSTDFPNLISTISRLSDGVVSSESVVSKTVDLLAATLLRARITIWLKLEADGKFVHSAANQDLTGESRFVFSRPIVVRGVNYGHIQVECLDVQPAAGAVLRTLEIIAIHLGLHSERARLVQERERIRAILTTEKIVARASGIVARERGLSVAKARKWLQEEAGRTGRTLYWLSDMLIAGNNLLLQPGFPLRRPTHKRPEQTKRVFA